MKKKTKITLTIIGSLLIVFLVVAAYIDYVVCKSIDDFYFPEEDTAEDYLDPWNPEQPNAIKPDSEPGNGEVRKTPLEIVNEAM